MRNKNKRSKSSTSILKNFVIAIFTFFALFVFYKKGIYFLRHSDYFTVKDIWYESSLKSIESSELSNLKGKSLLQIDLKKIQRQLELRYPQFGQLRVLKRFPNQILVVAQKRSPFAQARIEARNITLDEKGVVLSTTEGLDNHLPLITGVSALRARILAGSLIESRDLQLALTVIKIFKTDKVLSKYRIFKIDVSNLSEIYFYIVDNLKIIIDEEDFDHKLKMLGLLLSQAKLEPNSVRYIDLRFKEPILGKK